MAVIIFRTKINESVRRKGNSFNPEVALQQRAELKDLFKRVGVNYWKSARSLDARMVHILEGTHEQATMLEQILSASGAYEDISIEIMEEMDLVLSRAAQVRKLAGTFVPPNRDEIDRMLLDE